MNVSNSLFYRTLCALAAVQIEFLRTTAAARRGLNISGQLLLVVNKRETDLLAVGISSAGGDGAGLTVRRDDDATGIGNLTALLLGQRQGVVVDGLIRPHVGHWIAGQGVIFAVVLARPFVMRGFAVGADAIHCDF